MCERRCRVKQIADESSRTSSRRSLFEEEEQCPTSHVGWEEMFVPKCMNGAFPEVCAEGNHDVLSLVIERIY